ncbi:MAG: hypothetical protein A3F54_00385 [Candidatus Kerfeldbacteria bacterium RIFCSPHIGHO2_12_FULL_48_17]|uniref:Uncharacterized protein n=1 Tax=Candidatus Kerfeldbacteria bacterium RIFCSPHIGHO2_12_FULL_48_17 TaxID=1798542 RepID=A0A1G2B8L9_9BACT|nr:MAG: hypothetical protein A3F54_00385 [Candidatus Kerfeldbacteria bacterium RIFCSPHIGHO2_12_FULL_48_17]
MSIERNIFRPEDPKDYGTTDPRQEDVTSPQKDVTGTMQTMQKQESDKKRHESSGRSRPFIDEELQHILDGISSDLPEETIPQMDPDIAAILDGISPLDEIAEFGHEEPPQFLRGVMAEDTKTTAQKKSPQGTQAAKKPLLLPYEPEETAETKREPKTAEEIFAEFGLRPEHAATTPEEKAFQSKKVKETIDLKRGAIQGKEIQVFDEDEAALFKSMWSEFGTREDGSQQIFRAGRKIRDDEGNQFYLNGIKPGTYMIRERVAYLISEKAKFGQVPMTVLKADPEKIGHGKEMTNAVGSMQKWVNGEELQKKGAWSFLHVGKYLEAKQRREEVLDDTEKDKLGEYLLLKREFIVKALFDLLKVESDVCTHAANILVDDENLADPKLVSLDSALIFHHPFLNLEKVCSNPADEQAKRDKHGIPSFMKVDYSSMVTKFMRGEVIPDDILDNLKEFKEYLDSGQARQEWGELYAMMDNSFDEFAYMQAVLGIVLEKKRVLTVQDVVRYPEVQDAILPEGYVRKGSGGAEGGAAEGGAKVENKNVKGKEKV